jgi:hypothetical protein
VCVCMFKRVLARGRSVESTGNVLVSVRTQCHRRWELRGDPSATGALEAVLRWSNHSFRSAEALRARAICTTCQVRAERLNRAESRFTCSTDCCSGRGASSYPSYNPSPAATAAQARNLASLATQFKSSFRPASSEDKTEVPYG